MIFTSNSLVATVQGWFGAAILSFGVMNFANAQDVAGPEIAPIPESSNSNKLDDTTLESIRLSIDALGSAEFAERERAAERLMSIGLDAVPALRQLSTHDDLEVRSRAADLVRQLAEGDFQKRVEAFLSGKDVHFDGWEYFQSRLGSSAATRELFIELTKGYPQLVQALEGTSRDRALTQESTVQRIQTAMFVERRWPKPVDAVALLLPVADPDVPISPAFENTLIGLLRREAGTLIRRDQNLHEPFKLLLGKWVERSSTHIRGEIIWFSLDWGIPEVYPLALGTLNENPRPDVLVLAMQAIARYGNKEDAKQVAKFLDDQRPVADLGQVIGGAPPPRVGDAAMATIAMIYDLPLSELGWPGVIEHPTFSFIADDLAFPADSPESREKARAMIDELLATPIPKS